MQQNQMIMLYLLVKPITLNISLISHKILRPKNKMDRQGLNEKLINLANKKVIIKINPKLFRPAEVNILRGTQVWLEKN